MPDGTRRGRRPPGARPSTRAHRPLQGRLLVLLLMPMLLVPTTVSAQSPSSADLERQVNETEQRERELAGELEDVRSELERARDELARIGLDLEYARGELLLAEGQVALAELALEEAEADRDAADAAYVSALDLLAQTEAELATEEQVFTDQLVHTFKYGTAGATRGAMVIEVLRRAEDPNAFAVGMKQLQVVVDDQDAVVQNVFDLRERRSDQADDAARARGDAAQAAWEATEMLRTVEDLREQAALVAEQIEQDEARQQRILDNLQATAAQKENLLGEVVEEKDRLREQWRQERAREEEERRKAAEAARAAAPGSGSGRLGLPGADGGPGIDGLVCPVVGAVAGRDFSNDWGYPRSGGRTHQGNDIFASRGTPVVAVADGVVTRWNPPSSQTRLGGITVTYRTADGSEWYNAHLDTIADGISPGASVSRGQVIGTVGNTGNARTTPPHLHIGRRYDGSPVNPWPTISGVCN